MSILGEFWLNVKRLMLTDVTRPKLPKCKRCMDDLMLSTEVESGYCVDCQQPAAVRRNQEPPVVRAWGGGTSR